MLILKIDFYDELVEDSQVIEVIGGRLDVFVDKWKKLKVEVFPLLY